MKYIDADNLKAEIERRHAYQKEMYNKTKPDGRPNDGWAESLAIMGELEELLTFLDTLPEQPVEKTSYDTQKYHPRPSVSIEDVARVQFASHAKVFDKKRKAVFDWEQFKEVASIFYGFGKKDSPETKGKEQADGLEEAAEGSDFREKLAAYMKSAFEKGRYVLSSETILKMAEEELLKRGVVQKPAEIKEDEK